jgi:hypothetical protein
MIQTKRPLKPMGETIREMGEGYRGLCVKII